MKFGNKAILLLHLDQDDYCGPQIYGSWHEEFNTAMQARHANQDQGQLWTQTSWGNMSPYFWSYSLRGTRSGPMAQAMYGGDVEEIHRLTHGGFDLRTFWPHFFALASHLRAGGSRASEAEPL